MPAFSVLYLYMLQWMPHQVCATKRTTHGCAGQEQRLMAGYPVHGLELG
jgi:ribonuclease I